MRKTKRSGYSRKNKAATADRYGHYVNGIQLTYDRIAGHNSGTIPGGNA